MMATVFALSAYIVNNVFVVCCKIVFVHRLVFCIKYNGMNYIVIVVSFCCVPDVGMYSVW